MDSHLYDTTLVDLEAVGGRIEARLLGRFLRTIETLVKLKRDRHRRVLPLAEYLVDRWDKARVLGFGEGTNVYDSCLVIGDVKVGKNCWIGPYTILDGSGGLEIGDNTTVSAGTHIYTHDSVGQTLNDSPIERLPVRIGSRVYIGPNVVIAQGVILGDRVVVGANSFVNANIPSNTKAAGNPARVIGPVDR